MLWEVDIYPASGQPDRTASVVAGALFAENSAWPFWFFVAGMAICLGIGLTIYFGARTRMTPEPTPGVASQA